MKSFLPSKPNLGPTNNMFSHVEPAFDYAGGITLKTSSLSGTKVVLRRRRDCVHNVMEAIFLAALGTSCAINGRIIQRSMMKRR